MLFEKELFIILAIYLCQCVMRRVLFFKILLVVLLAVIAQDILADEDIDQSSEFAYKMIVAKRYDVAFPLLLHCAEEFDCVSQGTLGSLYYMGRGTEVDYDLAYKWWLEADEEGCNTTNEKYMRFLLERLIVVDNLCYMINKDNTLILTRPDYKRISY